MCKKADKMGDKEKEIQNLVWSLFRIWISAFSKLVSKIRIQSEIFKKHSGAKI